MEIPLDVDAAKSNGDILKHAQSMSGPAMMFVELHSLEGGYSQENILDLTGQWTDLLHSGGLSVKFYNIEENKVLVSLQKGWDGIAVKDFLIDRPEVTKVTWDNVDYTYNEESVPLSKKTRGRKKKKRQ